MAVDLAYTESGEGPPLILLHAFPFSSTLFDDIRVSCSGWRLVTPDLRGFGGSPLGEDEPDLGWMADDVVALMDRLDIESAVIGGVSMGGYVAMELLRRAPERIVGVVLIDTKPGADGEEARAGRLAMADAVLAQGRTALEPMMAGLLGETSRRERPEVVARVSAWLDEADPAAVAWAQRAMAERPDSLEDLRTAQAAGAVIVGSEDTLSPIPEAKAMAQAFGGVLVQQVRKTGHLAVVEDPKQAATQLRIALVGMPQPGRLSLGG